jgi:hypothetical protein
MRFGSATITFVVSNAIYIEFERGDERSDERVLSSFCAEEFVFFRFEGEVGGRKLQKILAENARKIWQTQHFRESISRAFERAEKPPKNSPLFN